MCKYDINVINKIKLFKQTKTTTNIIGKQ